MVLRKLLALGLGGVGLCGSLGGCRSVTMESFTSATTPISGAPGKGDTYSFGSVAQASGGLKSRTHYGEGADEESRSKVEPRYDQAAKGSGQQAGEYPNSGVPGNGQSNAPAFQPQPEVLGPASPGIHG